MVSRAPQLEPISTIVRRLQDRCNYAGIASRESNDHWMIVSFPVSADVNREINVPIFYSVNSLAEEWSKNESYRTTT